VVVTQILADAAQRVLHGDPLRFEEFGFADAGELQQLWGVERTAREDHLAPRADFDFGAAAPALAIPDADGALTLEDQAGRVHLGAHLEVRPLHRGTQKRARRTHAASFQDRALRVVDAELAFAV